MDIKLLTEVEKESIGERQPLPERYLRLSDDEMDARIAAAKATLGERVRHPRPSLSARRGHQVRRLHRRLAEAVARGRQPRQGRVHRLLRRPLHGRERRHPARARIRKSSCRISRPAARWPTWPRRISSRSAGASSSRWASAPTRIADGRAGVIPVTYINSSAAIKAFVGEHGGIVCTSTNARGDHDVGVGARREAGDAARSASRPEHRLQDGRAARPDGRLGSERDVGRPRAGAGARRRG